MEEEEKASSVTPETPEETESLPEGSEATAEGAEDEGAMSDEEKGSEESESSEEAEDLEDVEKLIVESSEEDLQRKLPPEELAEEPAGEDIVDVEEEEAMVRDELQEKEEGERQLAEVEELKREVERRGKMKVLLTGYLELKAKKEIEKALLNEKKIIAQWLYPFREAYQKEWELEMTKLKLAFEKALDYKKAHIHAIQRERKLTELNHLWADSAHYQISDELFDFMRRRCEKLKQKYLEELEETKKYYLEREQQILAKCTKAEQRANVLAHLRRTMHGNILKQTKESLERFKFEGEFLKEKEMELINTKHMTYVERIAHELQTSISPPEHRMDEIRDIFNEWKKKHESFSQLFTKNKRDLQAVADEIPDLEKRVATARKTLEELRRESKLRQKIQTDEIAHLQRVSKKYQKLQPSLRKMIADSEEVMVQLRERKSKLDRIMKLKKFCDQLETESDRGSNDISYLDPKELNQLKESNCTDLIRELSKEDVEDHSLLEKLYRKVSRVKLQNEVLHHDIEKLKIERMALKSDMKKFLQNIASGEWQKVPDDLCYMLGEQGSRDQDEQQSHYTQEDSVKAKLDLLNRKCRKVNKKILESVEENIEGM